MSAKAVKTLTIAGIGTYEAISAKMDPGQAIEDIEVTTLADARRDFLPHPQAEHTEMEIKIARTGTAPTVSAAATLVVAGTYANGEAFSLSTTGYVKAFEPDSIETGGARVAVWTVTFRPSSAVLITTTTTTTTTSCE